MSYRSIRYLPLSLLATASVLVLPTALVAWLIPPHGAISTLACALFTVVVSLSVAQLEAAAWSAGSRHGDRARAELVYYDLMLWGLARRWWAERRLNRLTASYERAARADITIRVELLEAIARLLESRSPHTHGHCRRVARHAEQIARTMRLTPAEVATIRTAALVHDVGKIYTPPEILHGPPPSAGEEHATLTRHSVDGARMLMSVRDPSLAAIVRHHHERVGGGGYPDGLIGEEIPLGARIVAVADAFDRLTSQRPGLRACSQREAMSLLAAEAGAEFDARAVDAFREHCSARRSVGSMALLSAISERVTGVLRLSSGGLRPAAGASATQLLPAFAAAGLLAVVPVVRHAPAASGRASPAGRSSGEASPGASAYGAVPGSSARRTAYLATASGDRLSRRGTGAHERGSGSANAPVAEEPNGPTRTSTHPSAAASEPPSASGAFVASSSPRPTSTPASAPSGQGQEAPNASQEAPQQPSEAPALLHAETPSVPVTPAISTPAITLPAVSLPPLNVPAVSIPSVTVPPITLPGVKLKLP